LTSIETSSGVIEVVRFLRLVRKAVTVYGWKEARRLDGKKIQRGFIYLGCGLIIAVIMVGLLIVSIKLPLPTKALKLTFYAETLALWLFGIAWMTASQFQFIRKIRLLLKLRRPVNVLVEQTA
jgi:hypothetical protein